MYRNTLILALSLGLISFSKQSADAAFVVEAYLNGKAYTNNFIGTPRDSSAISPAPGCVGTRSAFGSTNDNHVYVFTYTPGTDADNYSPSAGVVFGNNYGTNVTSTGAAGGQPGLYNVYVTWPSSQNVEGAGTDLTIVAEGSNVVFNAINQNNNCGCEGTNAVQRWWKLAQVYLNQNTTYAITSAPISAGFVSQRFQGVMWEYVPETVAPCASTAVPGVVLDAQGFSQFSGPLAEGQSSVTVLGVSGSATSVAVYQGEGSSFTKIGELTSGIVAGDNEVPVTGLVKGKTVSATQTISGQESCVQNNGPVVGGGANPSVKVALTIRETSSTGPIGAPGARDSVNLHFLGASTLSGLAPVDAPVVNPSNDWQTLTFEYTIETIESPLADSMAVPGSGYLATDFVSAEVYAYKTVGGTRIYSESPATPPSQFSNDVFNVNWVWTEVAEAEGYRLLRETNFAGFNWFVDVTTTNFLDDNTAWAPGSTVTPNSASITPSIQWNGTGDGTVGTPWCILDSIDFAVNGDTGPFQIYIDGLQNGTTVFQDFEGVDPGTADYGFRSPTFSGTTDDFLLSGHILGEVSGEQADTGTNSFKLVYQWDITNPNRWLRLTTFDVGDPLVDLSQPISFRMLLLPVSSFPQNPPDLSIFKFGTDVVLDWDGTFNLQAASLVTGTYTNVGVNMGPWTNTFAEQQKYFRLSN